MLKVQFEAPSIIWMFFMFTIYHVLDVGFGSNCDIGAPSEHDSFSPQPDVLWIPEGLTAPVGLQTDQNSPA